MNEYLIYNSHKYTKSPKSDKCCICGKSIIDHYIKCQVCGTVGNWPEWFDAGCCETKKGTEPAAVMLNSFS